MITPIWCALVICPGWLEKPIPEADDYVFVHDVNRWVGRIRGNRLDIGKLDARGDFYIPDAKLFDLDVHAPGPSLPTKTIMNAPAGPVCEYRSGRLIPGQLNKDGYFVPDLDAEIIAFKDYRYSPKARRIYNLPGQFVKKSKATGKLGRQPSK